MEKEKKEEKKVGWIKKHPIWSVFLGLIIIGIIGGILSEPTNNNINNKVSANTVDNQDAIIKQVIYNLNEPINVDYLTYEITRVTERGIIGDSYFNKKTEGKFVIIELKVTNNADVSKYIYTPRFRLIDNKDRKYDEFSEGVIYLDNSFTFGEQLQPGLKKKGEIVFEVPKDSTNMTLEISGSTFSTSQVLVNLGK